MQLSGGGARGGGIGLRLEVSFCETGIDVTRADAVDANAFLPVVDGHGFGKSHDGRFGGAVTRAHRLDKEAVHGRHIHDRTFRGAQMRQEKFRTQKDAAQVYRSPGSTPRRWYLQPSY